ncbi:MAG: hypothetical protein GF418_14140, partial [Chitinivibrionales bacterium]|nr:hypothetical protein [Chitinivibrionales bacterium]MBD3396759.1 hypothetical protein [Chitinivibrionales bacterium]
MLSDLRIADVKRSALRGTFIALALLTAVLCTKKATDPGDEKLKEEFQLKGSISGTVYDAATDSVLSGVAVTSDSGGYTSTSDSLGEYSIPDVAGRTYTITFTHAHYYDTTVDSVAVAIDEDVTGIDAYLRPRPEFFRGTIAGTVRDAESAAGILGVSVTADSGGYTTTTDSGGDYTIPDVIPATYTVSFTHGCYFDTSVSSVVVALSADVDGIDAVMRKNPTCFTGSAAGIVMDSVTRTPLSNVVVGTVPGGYTGTSTAGGAFLIENVPFGMYSISASVNHHSNVVESVTVVAGDTAQVDTLWAVRQDVLQREITGQITGNTGEVYRIEATIIGDLIDSTNPVVRNLTWLPVSKAYSGNIFVPEDGTVWTAEVRIYDDQDRLVAYQSMAFDKGAASVAMPTMDAENAKPRLEAGADTTVSIGDDVHLHAAAVDSFTEDGLRPDPGIQTVLSWEWAIGGTGVFAPAAADTTIIAPMSPQEYVCVVRVTDDEGNQAVDTTVVTIVEGIPAISAGADTTVSVNDSVHLHGTGSDSHGSIVEWAWDVDADGTFEPVGADTSFVAPPAANASLLCVLRATDDDANIVYDTVSVTVVLDAPAVNAGADTSVRMGDIVSLHGTAQQTYGTFTSWEWAIDTGSFKVVSSGDTDITMPDYYIPSYPCRLRVTDDDGNARVDTVVLTVGYQWEVMGGTGVSTNEARSISVESDPRQPEELHVCYVDGYSAGRVYDKEWNGAAWDAYGTQPISESGNTLAGLALTLETGCGGGSCVPYETPYVGYVNEGAWDSAVVKYTTGWTRIGDAMHAGSGSYCMGLGIEAISASSVYLAFIDLSSKNYLNVYTGGTSTPWSLAGGSPVDSSVWNLAFDMESGMIGGDNIPHIAYLKRDGDNAYTCTVKKYSSSVWTTLGSS